MRLTAESLRRTFPGCAEAPLALQLLRLLSEGEPVTDSSLAEAAARTPADVTARLSTWPNVERDDDGAVVGFSGLTLRPTPHTFELAGRGLHTWCAWDTLFLPVMLGETARVRSTCPVTGTAVELTVAPEGVKHVDPERLQVSFPSLADTDTANITGSFCCHVHFLAGDDAARAWQDGHPEGEVLDLDAAFALGCGTVAPLTAAGTGAGGC
jgi:alkylmercury lyase